MTLSSASNSVGLAVPAARFLFDARHAIRPPFAPLASFPSPEFLLRPPQLGIPAEPVAQQVVALAIVGESHVVGALIVFLFHGHPFIDGADLRVGDGGPGIGAGFGETLALGDLGGAPFDARHIRTDVHGDLAVMGQAEDQALEPAPKPGEKWM